ncbi:MAG: hypothetical protein HYZ53_27845, partial [Planctomycetes bacterium]|nr:hypothetical protein [Planctomycetota bacterium]
KAAAAGVVLASAAYGLVLFLRSDFAKTLRAEEPPAAQNHGSGGVHRASDGAGAAPGGVKETGQEEHSHGAPEHGLGNSLRDLHAGLVDEHENVRAKAAEEMGKLKDPRSRCAWRRRTAAAAA